MCRELLRAVGELWRTIGDAFNPYRPELHYMRGPGPASSRRPRGKGIRIKMKLRSDVSPELL